LVLWSSVGFLAKVDIVEKGLSRLFVQTRKQFALIGSSFLKGKLIVGRHTLPNGHVAFLDDRDGARAAIRDLHTYSTSNPDPDLIYAVIFRVVSEQEIKGINFKIQDIYGVDRFSEKSEVYCPKAGFWHIIDNRHIIHAHNEHSDVQSEKGHGHVPITIEDFINIPDLIHPRHIDEFNIENGRPRIVYRVRGADEDIVIVQEVRKKSMAFKTIWKQKKGGRGERPAGK
jgi:hypothetical protein